MQHLSRCALVMAMVGCSAGDGSDGGAQGSDTAATSGTPSGPATLILSFDLDGDLIPTMDEPAVGVFHGKVYAEDAASAIGPNEGSTSLVDFDSSPLDFGVEGGAVADAATVGPIDAQIVWIVGCFDSDANDCDCGDPITVPNENKMQILPGDGQYTVKMTLLDPQGC